MRGWGRLAALVAALAAAAILSIPTGAGALDGTDDPAVTARFEVRRLGGADLYDTSLLIAQEFASRSAGRIPAVVAASARSWQHAAVGASFAGGMDAPLLLVPPGGLRPDALSLLSGAGVSKMFAIGSASVLPEADLNSVRRLGVSVERVGGGNPRVAALAAAARSPAMAAAQSSRPDEHDLTGTPDTVAGLAALRSLPKRAVVLAGVDASGDAHVAAPFAARAGLPLLFTSSSSLDDATARFLDDHAVTHVVVSGVHGPPSGSLRDSLDDLGTTVVQLGNFGTLAASAAAADSTTHDSTGQFASWTRRSCPRPPLPTVGLASDLDVWDAFSAAPLLAHLCAPLLLTSSRDLSADANAVLYRALHTGTKSLLIFGGRAVIGDAAAEQASAPRVPIRAATVTASMTARGSGEVIVVLDESRRQRRFLSGRGFSNIDYWNLAWSPQRRHIAFSGVRGGTAGVFVLDIATGISWRVTPRAWDYRTAEGGRIAWSSDGRRIAFSVYFDELVDSWDALLTKVYVADIRNGSLQRLTFDDKRERHAGWAPDDDRLLILRYPSDGWNQFDPDELLVIDIDTRQISAVGRYEVIHKPVWSPDGSMIAVETWSDRCCTDMAHPEIVVLEAQEPHRTLLDGPRERIVEWTSSGCCLAIFGGYYADDLSLLNIASGQSQVVIPSGEDYWEGTKYGGISKDGSRVIATGVGHIQGTPAWVYELSVIDTASGDTTWLPLEGPSESFQFGGFSPDNSQIVYAASTVSTDSVFQLRIVDTQPGGKSVAALDLTSDLPRLSGESGNRSEALWQQLSWTSYGIHGTVMHWHR